jgi:hypothetical protein
MKFHLMFKSCAENRRIRDTAKQSNYWLVNVAMLPVSCRETVRTRGECDQKTGQRKNQYHPRKGASPHMLEQYAPKQATTGNGAVPYDHVHGKRRVSAIAGSICQSGLQKRGSAAETESPYGNADENDDRLARP